MSDKIKRNDPNIANLFFPAKCPDCPTQWEQYYKEMRELKVGFFYIILFCGGLAFLPFIIGACK